VVSAVRPVLAVRGIREIPHACACDWRAPDYRYPPRLRAWTLPASDPACRLHGTPGAEPEGKAA
jgi:hypothetical protein